LGYERTAAPPSSRLSTTRANSGNDFRAGESAGVAWVRPTFADRTRTDGHESAEARQATRPLDSHRTVGLESNVLHRVRPPRLRLVSDTFTVPLYARGPFVVPYLDDEESPEVGVYLGTLDLTHDEILRWMAELHRQADAAVTSGRPDATRMRPAGPSSPRRVGRRKSRKIPFRRPS
jgi:hypothetical protein